VSLTSNMPDRDIPSTANLYVLSEGQEDVAGEQLRARTFSSSRGLGTDARYLPWS
jgi:hypothetical protein